ncbi:MAG: 4-aminobutyrate--2-oxoglutarate transaminase [Acidobacteria bacterium]|nr:MAG: 4-aminobutyrate--2-oxoglutarate transaminase [Acidobacteriota bacterium]
MSNFIRLRTIVPGPKSLALLERRKNEIPTGVFNSSPICVDRAEGALVTDVDGNTYIDFAGGIGTLNVGHCNPDVVKAATAQLERFTHTCFSVAMYEGYIAVAEKLNRITPGTFSKKTMLANSGAEGIENAVKIARHYTKREGVIVFEHAFHGRTLLTMSMTSKVRPYKFGFGPFAPEIYRLPFPYEYRHPESCSIERLEEFFASYVAPESVACVVIELVLGEGGFIQAPREYVHRLAEICKKFGILLIVDEVQTGFARTGKMFACEHYDLQPDLLVLAKSIAGGLPLSSITGRTEIMESSQVGGLGGTFVGNPVSCAAALAAIEFLERTKIPERAQKIGQIVKARFEHFAANQPFIGDARGVGAMRAIEFVKDRKTKEPDKDRTNAVIRRCYENGVILIAAGTYGNVIRTLMPLTITDEQLNEGLDVIEHALQ